MADPSSAFRDFGILPTDLTPPAGKVRAFFSAGRVFGQYLFTGIVAAIGLGLAIPLAVFVPAPLGPLGAVAALVAFAAFIHLATHHDYRWIELDGNTLRARQLYTGRTIERSIDEIDCLGTMVYQVQSTSILVMERLLGRVKGVEVRFRDRRTPLRILRADPAMTNAAELIEALLYRMGQRRELDAEVVQWDGQPLVRRVWWKGQKPLESPGKLLKLCLGLVLFFALVFGAVAAGIWTADQDLLAATALPPQVIDLRTLIRNGPGDNRHVTITGFQPGGFAMESKGKVWTHVWVALFPADARPEERQEIKAVVWSAQIADEPALRNWLGGGRITGICSAQPRTNFGTSLGPLLVEANGGRPLTAAWSIEELRERPSAEQVTALLATSAGCFAVVLLLATVVFWKAR